MENNFVEKRSGFVKAVKLNALHRVIMVRTKSLKTLLEYVSTGKLMVPFLFKEKIKTVKSRKVSI